MNKPLKLTTFKFAYRRTEAALALGISPSTFDKWIAQKLMPPGQKIEGIRLWDAEELQSAWQDLIESILNDPKKDDENPFDKITG